VFAGKYLGHHVRRERIFEETDLNLPVSDRKGDVGIDPFLPQS
jgi:hypothetical protein